MMYFTTNDQILYPGFYDYSFNLTINKLAELVTAAGGRVQPNKYNCGYIVNRSLMEKIEEKKRDFERFKKFFTNLYEAGTYSREEYETKLANLDKNCKKEIDELEAIPNEPQKIEYSDYIYFILDGFYYGVSYSESQFSYTVNKQPIRENNTISKDIYSDCIGSSFLAPVYESDVFNNSDEYKKAIEAAAKNLLEVVKEAKPGERYRDSYKTRVSNTYNSGYHYERIYKPERTEKIDF